MLVQELITRNPMILGQSSASSSSVVKADGTAPHRSPAVGAVGKLAAR